MILKYQKNVSLHPHVDVIKIQKNGMIFFLCSDRGCVVTGFKMSRIEKFIKIESEYKTIHPETDLGGTKLLMIGVHIADDCMIDTMIIR